MAYVKRVRINDSPERYDLLMVYYYYTQLAAVDGRRSTVTTQIHTHNIYST